MCGGVWEGTSSSMQLSPVSTSNKTFWAVILLLVCTQSWRLRCASKSKLFWTAHSIIIIIILMMDYACKSFNKHWKCLLSFSATDEKSIFYIGTREWHKYWTPREWFEWWWWLLLCLNRWVWIENSQFHVPFSSLRNALCYTRRRKNRCIWK